MSRRGFALLAVLWVTVALAALAAGTVAAAREGQDGTTRRITLVRARWAAEGCLAAAHAELEAAVRAQRALRAPPADTIAFANEARCTVEALDPSAHLHADSAGPALLARLDSALASVGLDPAAHRDAFLTQDGDGRVNLNAAPREVLAVLPGLGAEAIGILLDQRRWGREVTDLYNLMQRLSPQAREALAMRLPELLPLVTFRTEALVLRSRGWLPGQQPVATVEEVVVAAGERAATVQRRVW
jgi:type II secretory pathway component PulK